VEQNRSDFELEQDFDMADSDKPDFENPNREPVISVMDLARLDDTEVEEGYRDGRAGEAGGNNRCRSYWHGWRTGSLNGKHREKDFWDSMLASNVTPGGDIIAWQVALQLAVSSYRPARLQSWRKPPFTSLWE
jgi:hypothetical protein